MNRSSMRLFQISAFFQMLAISVMNLYPLYWNSLGYSARVIGILNGIGTISAILSPLLFAKLGSRHAPAPIIARCFVGSALAALLMLYLTHPLLQTFGFTLGQILKIGYLTLVPVGVLHLLGERAGQDYGRYRRFGSAGFLLAGGIGLIIQETSPAITTIIVAMASGIAAIPFFRSLKIPALHAPQDSWRDLLKPPGTRHFLLGSLILSSWNAGVWTFLPLRMREMGASPNLIAWTLAECGLIAMLTLGPIGRVADRLRSPSLLYLFVPIAAALRLWFMALPDRDPAWFLLIQWMHAPVWVLGEVVQIQYVRKHIRDSLFPRAQAALQIATYAGMGIASLLMGWMVHHLGLKQTLAFSALFPLLALPSLFISYRSISGKDRFS